MKKYKKIILTAAFAIIGIIEIGIYWNSHLYYRAKEKIEDNEKKIKVLKNANLFYPSNDLVYYELGKAYFNLGINSLQDKELRDTYLQKSIKSFTRSLKINPCSIFGHFNFAQSLLYMSYFQPSFEVNYYDEYKKAALLTGHHGQIFYEVGKIFLSRWSNLSEEDKDFTIEILKKIVSNKDREQLQAIMQIWEMNVKDYKVMGKILPEDSGVYRLYAQFLGEKSLSCEVRQNILTQAEFLDYEKARNEYSLGQSEFQYFRIREAFNHFNSCLNILRRIKFYQNLTQNRLIDPLEFEGILRSVYLNLAKCLIAEGKKLEDVKGYLRSYFVLEDEVASINKLESYLRERGIIKEKLEESFNELGRLSFQILLKFKKNRYRDIMKAGTLLQQSIVVIPEAVKKDYVEILKIVGDSYQKGDYIFDAREFYQKALEIDPYNLESLLRFRKNCERLNDDEKIRETDRKIEKLLSPREQVMRDSTINKGRTFSRPLTLDGREITIDLHFSNDEQEIFPLISVFFNGRVIWENYIKNKVLSFSLNSKIGQNSLQIIPLNRSISLTKITYTFSKK